MTFIKEKADIRRDLKNMLYDPQRELYYRIKRSFKEGKPVAVCAGMRAGKTFTYNVLGFDYEHVMVVGHFGDHDNTFQHLRHCVDTLREYHDNEIDLVNAKVFFDLPIQRVTKDTLIILEDAFWWREINHLGRKVRNDGTLLPRTSEEFFEQVIPLTPHVLAVGSRGPQMFTRHEVWSYATWDLNTTVMRADLDDVFTKDPETAQRDFGG